MAAVIPLGSEVNANPVNWRRLAVLCGVIGAVLLLYLPATQSIGALWVDGPRRNYTHGYLVLAISLWLMWQSRVELGQRDAQPMPTAWRAMLLLVMLGTVVLWQFAYRAGIQIGMEVLLLPLVWMSVLMLLGQRAARAMFLPVAYLGFAMTFWDFLNPLAQSSTTQAVSLMLKIAGVPAHIVGNVVDIPSGSFEIQGGCSGLHFIIVGLAVAVLIGELRGDGWRMRLRWVLIAGVMAVLVNWVRVFSVILSGHLTHMQHYLVTKSHYGFGWVLFALGLAVLFWIERRTPLRPQPVLADTSARVDTSMAAQRGLAIWILATAVVLALPVAQNFVIQSRLVEPNAHGTPVPVAHGDWTVAEATASDWHPVQQHADQEARALYTRGTGNIELYRATYREQLQGKELGGYANHIQGDSQVIEESNFVVAGNSVTTMLIEREGRRSVLWITYRADGRGFSSATRAQLWYSWLTLRSARSPESEVLAIRAVCDAADCSVANTLLEQFVSDVEVFP